MKATKAFCPVCGGDIDKGQCNCRKPRPSMRTVLIDPEHRTVEEVTLDGYDKETFQWLYPVLDCSLVELVYLDRRTVLVIDEEGLLKPNHFFHLDGLPHLKGNPFAGKAILMMEMDDEDGGYLRGLTEKELPFAFLAVQRAVKWDGDDTQADAAMASGELRRPATRVSGMDDNFQPKGEPVTTWEWTPNRATGRAN